MIYSIMKYFSWFESALFHQLALETPVDSLLVYSDLT